MKKFLYLFCLLFLVASCGPDKEKADLLVFNATIYTVNNEFAKAEAFAVKDGKFLEVGTSNDLRNKYEFSEKIDAEDKAVYPGLIDAHAHFYGLGMQQQRVDLTNTQSFKEVVAKIVEFQEKNKVEFIAGRGWDQNDWEVKEFPVKDTLDKLFPDTPVAVTRIDGHAMLVNQAALDKAKINTRTKFEGGDIEQKGGKLTGILIDNPMMLIEKITDDINIETQIKALMDAQEICFGYGLTTVDDAGIDKQVIELIDSLHNSGELKIRLYAMISNTKKNLDYYLEEGPYKTDKLNVRSVKFYGDGALGSRGAALKEEYSDRQDHFGALLSPVSEFKKTAKRIAKTEFQMNTHAIGDSANYLVLKTYDSLLGNGNERRWRVEHSQVIDSADFKYFSKNIIPSIQPTHATSDMYWAEDRLGDERIKGAYAYKKLLDQAGMVALGTDFPVEQVNPFLTFYASVDRQDTENFPEGGFMREQALSREETLKGMTIWAAYSNFEEDEKGSIEVGKFADFVILDRDIMEVDIDKVPETKVISTFVNGEQVYKN
ncbi:amidohydrolase [Christiangramia forsetii]|uniref:Secreted amidohydrolase n=2 Tax=Christiangramia forsetii TaxID=411153 RepID=A0M4F0_CHRFK|nr:amidohydrolase [Christiangramia forsetii]GGG23578.1 amidohydrolase [Christiangramia forsetii]CAL67495.1 secreted amidohydrolase [Christiangramia forsetii KT0803]